MYAGIKLTKTLADLDAFALVQVRVKFVCAVNAEPPLVLESTAVPEGAVLENPFWPVSEHVTGNTLLLLQVSFVDAPLRTRVGSADNETVGGQRDSAGVVTEHTHVLLYVPVFVWPQEFAAEVHELPTEQEGAQVTV